MHIWGWQHFCDSIDAEKMLNSLPGLLLLPLGFDFLCSVVCRCNVEIDILEPNIIYKRSKGSKLCTNSSSHHLLSSHWIAFLKWADTRHKKVCGGSAPYRDKRLFSELQPTGLSRKIDKTSYIMNPYIPYHTAFHQTTVCDAWLVGLLTARSHPLVGCWVDRKVCPTVE